MLDIHAEQHRVCTHQNDREKLSYLVAATSSQAVKTGAWQSVNTTRCGGLQHAAYSQPDRQTERQTERQTDSHTDRQTVTRADRPAETDRQTESAPGGEQSRKSMLMLACTWLNQGVA